MLDNIKFVNRLAFLIGSIAVFILSACFVYYATYHWFKIKKIIVQGNISHITRDEILSLVQNKLHGTFFTLNIDKVQNTFEQIPWIKSVHVTREFPDIITINVVEYKAIANLGNNRLLSEERQIFVGTDAQKKLPLFLIPDGQIASGLSTFDKMKPFLNKHNESLNVMVYNGVGLTKLTLSSGMQVVLCGGDVEQNLQLLDKYWLQINQIESGVSYINMCYKNALAIKN